METQSSSDSAPPFFPFHTQVYAELIEKKLRKTHVGAFLVNIGWRGGSPREVAAHKNELHTCHCQSSTARSIITMMC